MKKDPTAQLKAFFTKRAKEDLAFIEALPNLLANAPEELLPVLDKYSEAINSGIENTRRKLKQNIKSISKKPK